MTEVRVYQMDAFTHVPFGGNPAGVVPNADGLTDEQMQKIARDMNCSETAFVQSTNRPGADVRVRFFTPEQEVDLCGHATISAFVVLGLEGRHKGSLPQTLIQETNVGLLPVMIAKKEDGHIRALMTQAAPQFRECQVSREEAAKWVGLDVTDIDLELPIGLAYTGLWDLIVPVKTLEAFQ